LSLRPNSLGEAKGEFVALAFPTNNAAVQGMAEILEPKVKASLEVCSRFGS
jgi:hypothetical protein